MMDYQVCDFHGHFLPGMDDGSSSVEESVAMLKAAKAQGIHMMCATPHYYPVETVEAFLARRQQSMALLQAGLKGCEDQVPRILPGAEVAYRQGIGNAEDLEKLCLEGTRYLLLELPFAPWDKMLFRDMGNIANVRGIVPIIAHVERYLYTQRPDAIGKLLEQDVILQMNASMLLDWRTRRKACKMLHSGMVQLLGSDCHNMTTRIPNLGPALEYLEKKEMHSVLAHMAQFADEIIG